MFMGIILLLVALCLSGIAGFYSIIGMTAIFSAAVIPIAIMTGVLELAKITLASWLYQHWKVTPLFLKIYFISAIAILMAITSLGIFGFLSHAHADQQLDSDAIAQQTSIIDARITSDKDKQVRLTNSLDLLDKSVTVRLTDSHAGQALKSLKSQKSDREEIQKNIDTIQSDIDNLNSQKLKIQHSQSLINSKLGPIRYVAQLFGGGSDEASMDSAVRYMILTIILVFDPLAVLMLIAANMSIQHAHNPQISSRNEIKTLSNLWSKKSKKSLDSPPQPEEIVNTAQEPILTTESEPLTTVETPIESNQDNILDLISNFRK